jgi:triosephosphate isomerase
MASHKTYIVGNWKMNLTVSESNLLLHRLEKKIPKPQKGLEVVLCPTALALYPLSQLINRERFKLGAQDLYHKDEGPFTGEVSAAMLRDVVDYAIIGHSERRKYFHETDSEIALKVSAALRHRITPILCVGETLVERQAGETDRVLHDQLTTDLNMLTSEDIRQVIITYEPVWAISDGSDFGTHPMPKPDEIERAVKRIRGVIELLHDRQTAGAVHILYGGSAHADMAADYLRIPGVNGLLVGGASLNYQQFSGIVEAVRKVHRG